METREFYRQLGVALAKRRRARNLTQAQLAERVGLSRAGMANVETGRQGVHVHQLVEIATALGVTSLETLLPANFWIDKRSDEPAGVKVTGSRLTSAERSQVSRIVDMLADHR